MRKTFASAVFAFGAGVVFAMPAMAQERSLGFSLTGGVAVQPEYFGASRFRVGPTGAFGFQNLSFGAVQLGDADGPRQFAHGAGLRGAFRYIPEREGKRDLAGLDDVDAALELGIGAHITEENWQVFGDLRYGVIGHKAFAGEIGANAIYRAPNGLVLHAGPRAEFGSRRFARSYFGVTDAEAANSALDAFTPSGGFHSIGVEAGAYQPLNADWGVTGTLRFDRLRGDAADSPIVQEGNRNQLRATIGLTRHFNLRF